ncbi:MAG: hypothetical protein ACTHLW_15860 [Verrucomicrobiota bacterium]
MKSSFELAMERLNKTSPTVKLTAVQKKQIAELDAKYAAKIAGREIALQGEMDQLAASGELEKLQELQQQLSRERKAAQTELEEKKEAIRQAKS